MRFGNYPSYHICKTLGLIPKSCFSLLWDQSQLQPVHDIGTDPKTLFFISLGSIPTMDCTWHWDWSQSPIFWPLGLIPMWHLDSAKSREEFCLKHRGSSSIVWVNFFTPLHDSIPNLFRTFGKWKIFLNIVYCQWCIFTLKIDEIYWFKATSLHQNILSS